ncbi:MAG TPA: hypothetical protein VHY22_18875, partial [Chthoniobacteraceae bacterium]|nr:hypothetical protein [Chthoniobacteraceae bacterium]
MQHLVATGGTLGLRDEAKLESLWAANTSQLVKGYEPGTGSAFGGSYLASRPLRTARSKSQAFRVLRRFRGFLVEISG